MFEHIGYGQNVTVSDLNIKNGTPIENEGNLTLNSVGMGEEVEIINDGVLNLKGKMDIIPEIHNNKETNIVEDEITLNSTVNSDGELNIQNSKVGIFSVSLVLFKINTLLTPKVIRHCIMLKALRVMIWL